MLEDVQVSPLPSAIAVGVKGDKGSALLGSCESTEDATSKCQFGKKKNKSCRAMSTEQDWASINDAQ